jgi:SAM-dependent methyltransferase
VADGEGRNGVWLAEQGWQVVSLDFSDVAQRKAADLAARRGVTLDLQLADVHAWDYPPAALDLVADIFSQFSAPDDRAQKWAGMARTLRPGGHLILQGYTPDQLRHGNGGPKDPAHLYTEDLLRGAFPGLDILHLEETDTVLDEGPGHSGPSSVIGLLARRPD